MKMIDKQKTKQLRKQQSEILIHNPRLETKGLPFHEEDEFQSLKTRAEEESSLKSPGTLMNLDDKSRGQEIID
jgi:hypothetical protein